MVMEGRMSKGIIYILINEAMPGYTKVGKTRSPIEQRMRELDSTGVPLPFECFHAAMVDDIDFVEKQLHDAFDDHRVRPRREFFRVAPERVQAALRLAEKEDATPRDDIVEDAGDKAALDKARSKRSKFNSNMVGIQPGAVLKFVKDPNITCTVLDHKKVEFEGEEMSLSSAPLTIIRRMGYTWNRIAGPVYWGIDGETLDERRQRMEGED